MRKDLQSVVQLLQTYAQLAELELTAGEKPRSQDLALPAVTNEQVREWADGEEQRVREKEELTADLAATLRAYGHDPELVTEAM